MEKKLRHVLSFAAACIFLIMALASFGPDTSTYLAVLLTECPQAPPIIVHPQLTVTVLDDEDRPIIGQPISVFTSYQKITDHEECTIQSTFENYTAYTNDEGTLQLQLSDMGQNSSGDLIRVEVRITETVDYTGARVAKLLGYGFDDIDFLIILNDKSVL